MVKLDSEVVAINVGGTHHMMTERDVLRLVPGSTLEKMFNGLHELKKNAIIGTSSIRRTIQLKKIRPDFVIKDISFDF